MLILSLFLEFLLTPNLEYFAPIFCLGLQFFVKSQ